MATKTAPKLTLAELREQRGNVSNEIVAIYNRTIGLRSESGFGNVSATFMAAAVSPR